MCHVLSPLSVFAPPPTPTTYIKLSATPHPPSFPLRLRGLFSNPLAALCLMAAVSTEDEPMTEELRQDRAQRALQVAVVSGFLKDSRSVQESCLGLCNACRDGVPLECILIQEEMPLSLLSVVLPNGSSAADDHGATRVLLPRRVLKVRCEWHEQVPDVPPVNYVANVDLASVNWPEGVKEVQLVLYDQALEGVAWPKSLERLSFYSDAFVMLIGKKLAKFMFPSSRKGLFNHPLQGVDFPSGLREIFLGNSFDQPIEDVVWPDALERLSMPGFNKSIDNVRWPLQLLALEFLCPSQILLRKEGVRIEELDREVEGFNRPFAALPASLETLWLSNAFAQDSLADIAWPSGLTTLGLGMSFGADLLEIISWPSSIRHIYSTTEVDLDNTLPAACEVTVVTDYDTESQSYELENEYDMEYDLDGHLYDPDLYDPEYPPGYSDDFEEAFIL